MRMSLGRRPHQQVDRLLGWIERGPRPRGRLALAAPLLVLVGIAVGVAVATGGGEDDSAVAQEPGMPTVPLERRDLIERASVDGTLEYAGTAEVINRTAGTITWLPGTGDAIRRGERLLEVDGEPVLLMYGSVPAYRDLTSGISDGADVRELERNLAALGHDPGEVDDTFTTSTAAAVAAWQDALGLEETGTVELGRVAFLAGPRRVTSLSVSLGSDAGSSSSPSGATASTDDPPEANMFLASATVPSGTGQKGKTPGKKPSDGGDNPKKGANPSRPSESDQGSDDDSTDPAASSTPDDSSGGGADGDASSNPSAEVMTTSSLRRVVTVDLDPADLSLAKRGRPARVTLPSGETVPGRVASVGTVAESSSSDTADPSAETETTVPVTVSLRSEKRVPNLDQAPVTVELIEEVRKDVLAVPVAAVIGTEGGGYGITVRDGGERRQITVEAGLFADGFVEISGDGLVEGTEVEVPEEQ
jgi:peptidoglycan hydrolase-like protein with peptidoglycan-binding domain